MNLEEVKKYYKKQCGLTNLGLVIYGIVILFLHDLILYLIK